MELMATTSTGPSASRSVRPWPGDSKKPLPSIGRSSAARSIPICPGAIESGKYDNQFWATTTLAGIVFMDGDAARAVKEIEVACAIPAATSFQLRSFRYRLELLEELGVQLDFVKEALSIVDQSIKSRNKRCTCERVFLWRGYPIDAPHRRVPRFPASQVGAVERAITEMLNDWQLGPGDLAICGGMTESDVLFADVCLKLEARVRLILRRPEHLVPNEPEQPLWPFADA